MDYQSHAKWSSGMEASDNHMDKASAMAVCALLLEEYGHTPHAQREGFVWGRGGRRNERG